MSQYWSALEKRLRDMEAEEEYDLFAIGYVIPQVALAQELFEQQVSGKQEQDLSEQDCLLHYIQSSVDKDRIEDTDRELIEQVLSKALENL